VLILEFIQIFGFCRNGSDILNPPNKIVFPLMHIAKVLSRRLVDNKKRFTLSWSFDYICSKGAFNVLLHQGCTSLEKQQDEMSICLWLKIPETPQEKNAWKI